MLGTEKVRSFYNEQNFIDEGERWKNPTGIQPNSSWIKTYFYNCKSTNMATEWTLVLLEMVTKIEEDDEEDKDEGEVGTMMSKLFVWGNNDKR